MPHAIIVEDDVASVEVLVRLLEVQGISSEAFTDPREFVATQCQKPDIVFLDLEMPHMTGYELYHWLREEEHCQAPIVAHTVNVNEIATAREMGFNGFLSKPLDPAQFGEQVATLLQGGSVWMNE